MTYTELCDDVLFEIAQYGQCLPTLDPTFCVTALKSIYPYINIRRELILEKISRDTQGYRSDMMSIFLCMLVKVTISGPYSIEFYSHLDGKKNLSSCVISRDGDKRVVMFNDPNVNLQSLISLIYIIMNATDLSCISEDCPELLSRALRDPQPSHEESVEAMSELLRLCNYDISHLIRRYREFTRSDLLDAVVSCGIYHSQCCLQRRTITLHHSDGIDPLMKFIPPGCSVSCPRNNVTVIEGEDLFTKSTCIAYSINDARRTYIQMIKTHRLFPRIKGRHL
jgi:hypothetical protein